MRPEHNFNVTVDTWEEAVFSNAAHFIAYRHHGRGVPSERVQLATFPEAKAAAMKDARILLYAVAESGRSVCLERKKWPRYDELWQKRQQEVV